MGLAKYSLLALRVAGTSSLVKSLTFFHSSLARRAVRGYVTRVKRTIFLLLSLCSCLLVSCKKAPLEVTSTEKRGLTTKDGEVKINATADERFRGTATPAATTSPYRDSPPATWTKLAGTQFRLLNYSFGAAGNGEVSVGRSQGSVIDNINRWRKQFGAADYTPEEIAALPKVTLLGSEAVMVEAQGRYESGMGKPGVDDFALAGLVALVGGDIVTIKMVGPTSEVAIEKANLADYAKSLQSAE